MMFAVFQAKVDPQISQITRITLKAIRHNSSTFQRVMI